MSYSPKWTKQRGDIFSTNAHLILELVFYVIWNCLYRAFVLLPLATLPVFVSFSTMRQRYGESLAMRCFSREILIHCIDARRSCWSTGLRFRKANNLLAWRELMANQYELKAAKYEMQTPSTCRATLFRCNFWPMFPVFHLAWSACRATKHLLRVEESCCSKLSRVYFEQQILALLLVFHQTHNLSRKKFARALAN